LAVLSKRILLVMALQIPISFFGIGVLHGLAPILASESFPTKFRYSGTGISYNLCHIFGGMIAPSVLAGLIGQDVFQKWFYVPACYAFYCIVAMLALLFIRETRDVNLEYLDQAEPALAYSARLQKVLPD
jgi:MFS family permease